MGDPGGPEAAGETELRPAGRHIASGARMALGAVGLVLAMALVAYSAVRFDSLFTAGSGKARGAAAAATTHPATPTPAAARNGPTAQQALQHCRALWSAQESALRTAAASLAQWQLHVSAMNRLVAGTISLQQAQAFWAKSRVAAAERVQAFDQADRRLGQVQDTCTAHDVQPAAAATRAQLRSCVLGALDRSRTVVAAERSIATWEDHINDMEMFRMGQMSAQTAARMWSKNWHRGQSQLDSYRAWAQKAAQDQC